MEERGVRRHAETDHHYQASNSLESIGKGQHLSAGTLHGSITHSLTQVSWGSGGHLEHAVITRTVEGHSSLQKKKNLLDITRRGISNISTAFTGPSPPIKTGRYATRISGQPNQNACLGFWPFELFLVRDFTVPDGSPVDHTETTNCWLGGQRDKMPASAFFGQLTTQIRKPSNV